MVDLQLPPQWEQWLARYGIGTLATQVLAAVAVFLVTLMAIYVLKNLLARRVSRLARRTASVWDDAALEAVQQTRVWCVLAVAAFCASLLLPVSEEAWEILKKLLVLVLLLQAGFWGSALIREAGGLYVERRQATDPAVGMTISALALIGRLVLFVLLMLLALENVGIEVTAFIAGLGVGGIAVALAVQNILGDLLASLSIVFDKPFVPGDFIVVGDQMGTVQRIGLKTTRVTSLAGEQIVFSNNDLLQSRIHNHRQLLERRVVFSLGVTYQTPREMLLRLPEVLRECVEGQEEVRFDRAHFKAFGESALLFEVVYYVLAPEFGRYMDLQQAINLAIHERFEQLGVEFAYPTRTLYVDRLSADAAPQE